MWEFWVGEGGGGSEIILPWSYLGFSFMQMDMPWAPRAPGLACTPSTDGVSVSSTLTKTHHDTRPVLGGPSSFLVCTEYGTCCHNPSSHVTVKGGIFLFLSLLWLP